MDIPSRLLRRSIGATALAAALWGCGSGQRDSEQPQTETPPDPEIQVHADSEVRTLIWELKPFYEQDVDADIRPQFAPTQTLARQIDAGIAVDLLIADGASVFEQMQRRPIETLDWVSNRLVMVARKGSQVTLDQVVEQGGKIAMGAESTVLGTYTRLAIRQREHWFDLRGRIMQFQDPQEVLGAVASGEAAAGIVFSTQAIGRDDLEIVEEFPLPRGIEMAYTLGVYNERGRELADWLRSSSAIDLAAKHGFLATPEPEKTDPNQEEKDRGDDAAAKAT